MRDRLRWTRRDFLQMAGYSSLGLMSARLAWPCLGSRKNNGTAAPRFAYVGYADQSGAATSSSAYGIELFAAEGKRWSSVGTITSDHPSFLTLHPSENFLYVINELDRYESLPSGSVQAYAVDAIDGSLALLNRQPLSLSATSPRHMAISPDGRALVVAVHGGGAYNVLPINEDGRLGRVSGILKEIGSGRGEECQQAAHPQMVLFDKMGRLLSADMGSGKLSVFTLDSGRLTATARRYARPGSGPRHIALHPNGNLLFVADGLNASVSCYGYDKKNGRILNQLEHVTMIRSNRGEKGTVVMAMHPSGKFLYTAHRSGGDGIRVWRSNSKTGTLREIQHEMGEFQSLHGMTMAPDGSSLLALSRNVGGVIRWRIDQQNGRLMEAVQVAKVQAPISMVVKYL
jgi:6-phosphogluconolactonase